MAHTQEPWFVGETTHENGEFIETAIMALNGNASPAVCLDFGFNNLGMRDANAERIVLCVNACAGIPNSDLQKVEGDVTPVFTLLMQYAKERDDLLAALKEIIEANKKSHVDFLNALAWGRAAIAKVEAANL